jgi:excisionase family DNA binding protein
MYSEIHARCFLSRQEAAIQLGISLPTLARRLADGSIPYTKLGGRVLIPAEYFDQLVTSALSVQGRQ